MPCVDLTRGLQRFADPGKRQCCVRWLPDRQRQARPANILTVNSAADLDGDLTLIGGAGNDKLTGGSGDVL